MTEIWINYGDSDAVLEIMAENLAQTIDSGAAYAAGLGRNAADAGMPGSGGTDSTDAPVSAAAGTSPNTEAGKNPEQTAGQSPDVAPARDSSPNAARLATVPSGLLEPSEISERLGALDVSRPFDLVPMHDSPAVRQAVSSIFTLCEQHSDSFPGILADRDILAGIRQGLPEGAVAGELAARVIDGEIVGGTAKDDRRAMRKSDADVNAPPTTPSRDGAAASSDAKKRNLVFLAETEFDGLFGYETVATRLLRKFGADEMLAAYARRDGNIPAPGRHTKSFDDAIKFADRFEISGIDIACNTGGIFDIFVGNPSQTAAQASASLESHSIMDVEPQKTLLVSTGKASSNATLNDALSSVWNCYNAVRNNGLLILAAACSSGLGSGALRMAVEGNLNPESLQNPSSYVSGMEDVLFLDAAKTRCQVALVSVLPELYAAKLGIIPIAGMRPAVEYMKTTQGARQKASIVADGSRILLR